jgi:serine/threonine protein kinase
MGVVWEAVHAVTRKPVALKILKRIGDDDGRAAHRLFREARAACAVHHPSVVQVHDVLELDDGAPAMVMELLVGETLAQKLARQRVMSVEDLARIMVHVCSAVGCAHALGIVHRDLKPENIFLAESPKGGVVKVLDFGIAKLTASEGAAAHTGAITGTGAILGTPYYMAPEQLFGERDVDHRADIWALGIIFYEALTGVRPTRGKNVGQTYKVILTDAIVPLRQRAPHLPAPLIDFIDRMLSRDRTRRPADMSAVLSVLADYAGETFMAVTGPPALPRAEAVDTHGSQTEDDSDTALALTADTPPRPHRYGVEIPPAWSAPSGRGRSWAVLLLVVASIVGTGGFVEWRARGARADRETGANAGLAVKTSIRPPAVPPAAQQSADALAHFRQGTLKIRKGLTRQDLIDYRTKAENALERARLESLSKGRGVLEGVEATERPKIDLINEILESGKLDE